MTATFEAALGRHEAGQLGDAQRLCLELLDADPNDARAAFLLGATLLDGGRTAAAIAPLEHASRLAPENAGCAALLGEAYRRVGRWPQAAQCFAQSMYYGPNAGDAVHRLGRLLLEAGEFDAAVACLERAREIEPENADLAARLEDARAEYRRVGRRPARPGERLPHELTIRALLALADVHRALGRRDEAIAFCRRAHEYAPRFLPVLKQLAEVLANAGYTEEGARYFREALALDPHDKETIARLFEVLQSSGRLPEAVELLRGCSELETEPVLHSLLLMRLPYLPGCGEAEIARVAREWDRRHGAALTAKAAPFDNDRSPERRLRIGYASPSFRVHVHRFFLEPLFRNHDRSQFELFLYSDVAKPDAETELVRAQADAWRETSALDHEALAARIRDDRVDILVDISMHTNFNRLPVYARKPAPVQVCWLAYPGTTGLSAIDYRVTDRFLDPEGVDLSLYAEQSLFLPDSYWCYSPRATGPEPGPLPAGADGPITFGCQNNYIKLNTELYHLWARVLGAVPGSRLVVLVPPGDPRRAALRTFAERGVDASRIRFVEHRSREEYLGTYREIDVCLDTSPYNGHTTTLDAFWMGVPVVSLRGATIVGRAGVDFAMHLALPELVAESAEDYVRIAKELAEDRPRLGALRAGLRRRMEASPLMDGPRFASNMEALYRRIWRRWCETGPRA